MIDPVSDLMTRYNRVRKELLEKAFKIRKCTSIEKRSKLRRQYSDLLILIGSLTEKLGSHGTFDKDLRFHRSEESYRDSGRHRQDGETQDHPDAIRKDA